LEKKNQGVDETMCIEYCKKYESCGSFDPNHCRFGNEEFCPVYTQMEKIKEVFN